MWEDTIGKTWQPDMVKTRVIDEARETKTDKGERRVQRREKISQSEWKWGRVSEGGWGRTRCPVSCTCRGRQISQWSVPKCPPAVCNRIFQATAGSLWGNFVRGRSKIRVNAGRRFRHHIRRSGRLCCSLLIGLCCQHQSVTKDFFLQNSLAISDISNKLIVSSVLASPVKS